MNKGIMCYFVVKLTYFLHFVLSRKILFDNRNPN